MRAFHAEVHGTAVGTYEFDASGVCLSSIALVFTGTATATVDVYVGYGQWTAYIASTSSNTSTTAETSASKLRLNITDYTDGTVSVYFNGLRG